MSVRPRSKRTTAKVPSAMRCAPALRTRQEMRQFFAEVHRSDRPVRPWRRGHLNAKNPTAKGSGVHVVFIVLREVGVFARFGGDLLSHDLSRSTIGAVALNGRVRNGTGCFAHAMTTKPSKNPCRCAVGLFCGCWACDASGVHVFGKPGATTATIFRSWRSKSTVLSRSGTLFWCSAFDHLSRCGWRCSAIPLCGSAPFASNKRCQPPGALLCSAPVLLLLDQI